MVVSTARPAPARIMRSVRLALAALAAVIVCVLLVQPALADNPFSFDDDDDAEWDEDDGAPGHGQGTSGSAAAQHPETAKHTSQQLLWGSYRPQNYFGFRPRLSESLFMGLAWSDASTYQGLGQLRHATNDQQQIRYVWTRHDGRTFGEERIVDPATNVGFNVSFVKSLSGADEQVGGGSWAVRVQGEALDGSRSSQPSFYSYFATESPETTMDFTADAATGAGFPRSTPIELRGNSPELGQFGIRVVHPTQADLDENNVVLNKPITGTSTGQELTVEETAYFSAPLPHAETWRASNLIQNGVAVSMQNAIERINAQFGELPREEQARSMLQWDTHEMPHPGVAGRLPNMVAPGEPTFTALQSTYELNPVQARGNDLPVEDATTRHLFAFDIFFDGASGDKLTSAELTRQLEQARTKFDTTFSESLPITHISDSEQGKQADENFARELISSVLGGVGYFHGTAVVDRSLSVGESDTGDETGSEVNGQPIDLDAVDNLRKIRLAEAADDEDESPVRREGPYTLTTSTPGRSFFPRGFYWDEGFHLPAIGVMDPELGLEILHDWFSAADDDGWIPREMALGTEAESRVPPEFLRQDPAHANPPTPILALRLVIDRLGLGLESTSASNGSHLPLGKKAWEWDSGASQLAFGTGNATTDAPSAQLRRAALDRLAEFYPTLKKHYGWFCRSQFGLATAGGRTPSSEYVTLGNGEPGQCAAAFRWRGRSRAGHVFASGLDDYPRASVPHTGELHVDLHSWMAAFARNMAYVAQVLAHHGVPVPGEQPVQDAEGFSTDFKRLQQNLEELHWSESGQSYCDLTIASDKSVPECHEGYVALLPLFLGIVEPTNPHLGTMLNLLGSDRLWSEFGIRSLSTADSAYGTGEDYWRGPIWMPLNYLALGALKRYSQSPGPYAQQAQLLYGQLRHNVVRTVQREYARTGYTWEQYNPESGEGQRSHPFTGWTALVALALGEVYFTT